MSSWPSFWAEPHHSIRVRSNLVHWQTKQTGAESSKGWAHQQKDFLLLFVAEQRDCPWKLTPISSPVCSAADVDKWTKPGSL
jgi:hypothetical protein